MWLQHLILTLNENKNIQQSGTNRQYAFASPVTALVQLRANPHEDIPLLHCTLTAHDTKTTHITVTRS